MISHFFNESFAWSTWKYVLIKTNLKTIDDTFEFMTWTSYSNFIYIVMSKCHWTHINQSMFKFFLGSFHYNFLKLNSYKLIKGIDGTWHIFLIAFTLFYFTLEALQKNSQTELSIWEWEVLRCLEYLNQVFKTKTWPIWAFLNCCKGLTKYYNKMGFHFHTTPKTWNPWLLHFTNENLVI